MLSKAQYFGFYLGNKVILIGSGEIGILLSVSEDKVKIHMMSNIIDDTKYIYDIGDCKLMLKPYKQKDYGELEARFWANPDDQLTIIEMLCNRPLMPSEEVERAIENGEDIFNLRERGYALYEEDIIE